MVWISIVIGVLLSYCLLFFFIWLVGKDSYPKYKL